MEFDLTTCEAEVNRDYLFIISESSIIDIVRGDPQQTSPISTKVDRKGVKMTVG
jgi:hypothetical protein